MVSPLASPVDDAIEIIAERKQEEDNYYSFLDWSIYSVYVGEAPLLVPFLYKCDPSAAAVHDDNFNCDELNYGSCLSSAPSSDTRSLRVFRFV